MATACNCLQAPALSCCPEQVMVELPPTPPTPLYPPINFFYVHLHDSIRSELELLAALVGNLAEDAPLGELQERFKFLGQLNQYHSSVEDEVVYPALDSKVKNVTVAYSVEHQDEEMLFEQLAQLIHTATEQSGMERTETVRCLICKVEEIHWTLKKHLTKEEEQLLPLLLQHFSFSEQAELVAQFLYCIPLATVERVLAWLKPTVPKVELEQLLGHMRSVVPDKLLLQLLSDWLKPDSYSSGHSCGGAGAGGPALPAPQFLQPLQQAASTTTTSGSACTFARTGSAGGSGSVSAAPPPPAEVGIEECCGQPGLCLGVQLVKRTPGNARTLAEVARPLLQAPLLGDTVGESEPTPIATPSHPQQQQQQQRSLAAATAAAASYTSDGLGGEAGGGAAASSPNAESSTTFTEGRGEGFARDRDCRYGNSAAPQQQQQQRQCPVVSRAPASMPLNITATPRPPIKEIIHIHRTICASLEDFACEVALLQQLPGVTPQQLALLVERHRFLRSVCMFHSISEDEIMYPEVRRLTAANPSLASAHNQAAFSVSTCEKEHESEVSALEDLGRLLSDVRAFVRRGRKEVDTMLGQLHRTAQQVCSSIAAHMAREEADVFPLLARHLCATQQRLMVWRTLRAMPLRLLERVMPSVTAKMSEAGTQELLNNIRLGAPASDLPLVQLVMRWAAKGQQHAHRDRLQQQQQGTVGAPRGLSMVSPSPSHAHLPLLAQSSPSRPPLPPHQQQQQQHLPQHEPPESMCSTLHTLQHQQQQATPSPRMSRNPSLQQLQQQQQQQQQEAQFEVKQQQQQQERNPCVQQLQQQYHEAQRHSEGLLPLAPTQPSTATPTPASLRHAAAAAAGSVLHQNGAQHAVQQQQQQQHWAQLQGCAAEGAACVATAITTTSSILPHAVHSSPAGMGQHQGGVGGSLGGFPQAEAMVVPGGEALVGPQGDVTVGLGETSQCEVSGGVHKRLKRMSDATGGGGMEGQGFAHGAVGATQAAGVVVEGIGLLQQQQQLKQQHMLMVETGTTAAVHPGLCSRQITPPVCGVENGVAAVGGAAATCGRKRGRGEGLLGQGEGGAHALPATSVCEKAGGSACGAGGDEGGLVDLPGARCVAGDAGVVGDGAGEGVGSCLLTTAAAATAAAATTKEAGCLGTLSNGVQTGQAAGAEDTEVTAAAAAATACGSGANAAAGKQQQQQGEQGQQAGGAAASAGGRRGSHFNPIDHIFQFHQALRQELKQLESDALGLERVVLSHLQETHSEDLQQHHHHHHQCSHQHSHHHHHQQQQQQQQQVVLQNWYRGEPVSGAAAGCRPLHTANGGLNVGGGGAGGDGGAGDSKLSSMGSGMCGYISRLPWRVAAAMQALDGRFQFLWGIYKAHSRSEDEIVFPALESKQALRNVSHAYTLDHQEEEKQFSDLEQVMATLRSAPDVATARSSTLAARRMCAAVRASLETHIRAEEAELWPLFTEHFSTDEQQYLVGVIIGRTGAQVLQALLPWISGSFSLEDKEMMMGSLRQATKNTMFDQWLDAVTSGTAGGSGSGNEAVAGAAQTDGSNDNNNNNNSGGGGHVLEHPTPRTRYQEDTIDPDLARYLSISPAPGKEKGRNSTGPCSSGSGVKGRDGPAEELPVESSTFRPGWEDIFRMNQKQLEAAVMRVSADPNLEPGRKAYLIQNIMVSKYIVAQQRRMQEEQEEEGSSFTGASPNDGAAAGADPARFQGRAPRRTYHDAAQGILGCKHYKRRTQLVAPCCDQVFTCRLCHDEAMPSHRMDRSAVREMVCMECGTRQPVGSHCARCATQMARYYCNICHLFDDQEGRDIYHCPFCNVCRRGRGLGIDFFHCMSCNACMSLSLFKVHNCREKAMESNCPVCSEFLFDSADSIKELPCGHFMHTRCFAEYTRYNYTCPICSKSVGDMHVYFQMLDSLLASERLPPEYAGRMQQVLCNDCGKTGFTRFHWAYHSCPHCRSYNTRLL